MLDFIYHTTLNYFEIEFSANIHNVVIGVFSQNL